MEKQIVKDKVFSVENIAFSKNKPIKFLYKGLSDPIFTIKANYYNLSTNKPHTNISLKQLENHARDFLVGLDEIVPKVAYENRKEWFTSDLLTASYESFVENYRKNMSEYGFSIYLGIIDKDELPVGCFIRDLNYSLQDSGTSQINPSGNSFGSISGASQETRRLTNSFQELAWGNNNGQVTILAQITGLWIKEESYGLSWKVLQILYRRKPLLPDGCSTFLSGLSNFREQLLTHTWQIPPDEADPVELPDEEDPILLNKVEKEDDNVVNQNTTPVIITTGLSEGDTGIDPSNLPSKPYNPLLETDD